MHSRLHVRLALGLTFGILLGSAVALTSCGGVHHVATVTVVSSHQALVLTRDFVDQVTCGAPSAPVAPACLPVATRNTTVAAALSTAFGLDIAVASAVRNWPGPPASLGGVPAYLAQITAQINAIVAALPPAARAKLTVLLGGKA